MLLMRRRLNVKKTARLRHDLPLLLLLGLLFGDFSPSKGEFGRFSILSAYVPARPSAPVCVNACVRVCEERITIVAGCCVCVRARAHVTAAKTEMCTIRAVTLLQTVCACVSACERARERVAWKWLCGRALNAWNIARACVRAGRTTGRRKSKGYALCVRMYVRETHRVHWQTWPH